MPQRGSHHRPGDRGLPPRAAGADIYVYDNNSTDRTAEVAKAAGAIVRFEPYQGKGNVVRRMFADIDADIYVLADGDLTYDASAAGRLVDALIERNADMVVGVRVSTAEAAYRPGHRAGNRFFNQLVARLFGHGFTDILSGYRVMSRRFAKSFPAASSGFEIETELSVHALDLKLVTVEIPLVYGERPENSKSKLRTYRDGLRILAKIVMMYRALKPLQFYGLIALGLMALSVAARHARADRVRPHRPRAAHADRPAGGGHHAARLPQPGLRHHHGRRQRQPARAETHAVPAAAGAGANAPAAAIRRVAERRVNTAGLVDERYYQAAAPRSLGERITVLARDRIYDDFVAVCRPRRNDTILDVGVSDVVNDAANMMERKYPHRRA